MTPDQWVQHPDLLVSQSPRWPFAISFRFVLLALRLRRRTIAGGLACLKLGVEHKNPRTNINQELRSFLNWTSCQVICGCGGYWSFFSALGFAGSGDRVLVPRVVGH